MSEFLKQVIVVRKLFPDGRGGFRGTRRGKELAQIAHATKACLKARNHNGVIELPSHITEWLNGQTRTITLQVDHEEDLVKVAQAAQEAGLECHVIEDLGLTEFGNTPTKTCLAIGPDLDSKIDPITKHLSLY